MKSVSWYYIILTQFWFFSPKKCSFLECSKVRSSQEQSPNYFDLCRNMIEWHSSAVTVRLTRRDDMCYYFTHWYNFKIRFSIPCWPKIADCVTVTQWQIPIKERLLYKYWRWHIEMFLSYSLWWKLYLSMSIEHFIVE